MEVKYTINPDYSGKIETRYQSPVDPMGFGAALKDPEGKAKKELAKMIDDFPGVASWTDIKYDYVNDSTDLVVSAVGYFKDFNDLEKKGLLPYDLYKEDGKDYLSFKEVADSIEYKNANIKLKTNEELGMTQEQVDDTVKTMKRNAKRAMGMMSMVFSNIEFTTSYEFAGNIYAANSDKKIGTGRKFEFGLDGMKFQNFMMEAMGNKEFYEKQLRGATEFNMDEDPSESEKMKELFIEFLSNGNQDISKIRVEFTDPIFDFDEEYSNSLTVWNVWKDKLEEYRK
jgi:hypothetical protein